MIFWLVFGALAGWIASKIVGKDAQMGAVANILVGVVGSWIGGFLGTRIFHFGKVTGFNLPSLLIAVAGSVILLLIVNAVTGRR